MRQRNTNQSAFFDPVAASFNDPHGGAGGVNMRPMAGQANIVTKAFSEDAG